MMTINTIIICYISQHLRPTGADDEHYYYSIPTYLKLQSLAEGVRCLHGQISTSIFLSGEYSEEFEKCEREPD